jgi:hypothetical protein
VINYLLWAPESSETGETLLNWLIDNGASVEGGKDPGDEPLHHLIRWGSYKPLPKKTTGKVLNSKTAVQLASDKAKSLKVMKAADVNIPPTWLGTGPVPDDIIYPCLGRQDKHSHGSDIVLCLRKFDVEVSIEKGCTHWTAFIPVAREFRIHIFDGYPIKISEKMLTDKSKFVPYIRNFETGWTFHNPKVPVPKGTKLEAIGAVEALGLTFGAVDVVVDEHGDSFVLEVNTAPGLIEDGVERYGKRFLVELAA